MDGKIKLKPKHEDIIEEADEEWDPDDETDDSSDDDYTYTSNSSDSEWVPFFWFFAMIYYLFIYK